MHLISDSLGYDASLIALLDATRVADHTKPWLIVGGHMVNLHIVKAGLRYPLRLTRDADLAVELPSITEGGLVYRLRKLGYDNVVYHNRFDRDADGLPASIDLVVPSHSTKHVPNIDALVIKVDGMPALDAAFQRPPDIIELIADMFGGGRLEMTIQIPDAVSALAMKTFAVAERSHPRDAEDLGHLLEAVAAGGIDPSRWPSAPTFAVAAVQLAAQFDAPGSALALATQDEAKQARLRAITRALLGTA